MQFRKVKNRKGQQLIVNFIYVFFVIIGLYFAYLLLSPMMATFIAGQNAEIQIIELMYLPFIFIFFLIYMFKTFKKGEGQ